MDPMFSPVTPGCPTELKSQAPAIRSAGLSWIYGSDRDGVFLTAANRGILNFNGWESRSRDKYSLTTALTT